MFDNLLENTTFWSGQGRMSDVVLTSRLSLARNLSSVPFPDKINDEDLTAVTNAAERFCDESRYSSDLTIYNLKDIDEYDRRFLRERNIITEKMENSDKSSLLYDNQQRFSIQINNDDHFLIQVARSGFEFYESYRDIVNFDNDFNEYAEYAFSEKYGFLTSDINGAGTGLSVSALLHLPVLTALNTIDEVVKMADEIGAHFSSVSRDQNSNYGSFYTVCNGKSRFNSEMELIDTIDDVVKMVVDLEVESRDEYSSDFKMELEDRIWRSFGLIKYARTISYIESLEYLSNVRLGIILHIIKDHELKDINDLFVKVQPAHLKKISKRPLDSPAEFDTFRAEYLRNYL